MKLANCVAGAKLPDISPKPRSDLSISPSPHKVRKRRCPERLYERECLQSEKFKYNRDSKKRQYHILPSATFFQPKDGMTRAGRINADCMSWAMERFENGGRCPNLLATAGRAPRPTEQDPTGTPRR